MKKQIIVSLKLLGIMTLLLGVIYPLFITGFAQLAYPFKANGSLVEVNGIIKGSELIGQKSVSNIYFTPRPSAMDYNTLASGGSNLGLTSKKLHDIVEIRKTKFIKENDLGADAKIPSELLFASASGLDPHISPQAAKLQVKCIVSARNFSAEQNRKLEILVDKLTENPQFGIFGCSRINVFMLNLELDKLR